MKGLPHPFWVLKCADAFLVSVPIFTLKISLLLLYMTSLSVISWVRLGLPHKQAL